MLYLVLNPTERSIYSNFFINFKEENSGKKHIGKKHIRHRLINAIKSEGTIVASADIAFVKPL